MLPLHGQMTRLIQIATALKDAYNDYLDALEDWEDCAEFYDQVTSWQGSYRCHSCNRKQHPASFLIL